MVNDKFQVRSTGPVNPVTKQPIKGRKAGGGVRFGEMERDSLSCSWSRCIFCVIDFICLLTHMYQVYAQRVEA